MNITQYVSGLNLGPSDWVMLALSIPLSWFVIRYVLMTKWWVDALGWGVALMALSFSALYALVVYGTLADGRASEYWRLLVMLGLFLAWTLKDIALERERAAGRLERRMLREHPRTTGSTPITKEKS